MHFNKLYRKAMSPQGLSANFIGVPKNTQTVMKKQKTLNFSIENRSSTAKTFALTIGGFPTFEALKEAYPNVDALFKEGVMLSHAEGQATVKDIVCEVTNGIKIANIQEHVKRFSGVCIKDLELRSENRDNYLYEVELCVPNPFEVIPTKSIPLRQFIMPNATDQNRLVANGVNLPFNNDILVLIHIKGDSQIDYSALVEYDDVNDRISIR
jgi:hypothetical protein